MIPDLSRPGNEGFGLLGLRVKAEKAIETLRLFALPNGSPYWGAFSGGKDSCVIKKLAELAGVPVVWHYSVTTVDPPELVRFIRKEHPDVWFDLPKMPLWAMIYKRSGLFPPTRIARWCCREYKESRCKEGRLILGVRAEESPARAARWRICTPKNNKLTAICPILYWTTRDVWAFHKAFNLSHCSLYDEGWDRIGCVLCPMTRKRREQELARWPRIAAQWKKGITLCWEERKRLGREFEKWGDSPEVAWRWWLELDNDEPEEECQGLGLFL